MIVASFVFAIMSQHPSNSETRTSLEEQITALDMQIQKKNQERSDLEGHLEKAKEKLPSIIKKEDELSQAIAKKQQQRVEQAKAIEIECTRESGVSDAEIRAASARCDRITTGFLAEAKDVNVFYAASVAERAKFRQERLHLEEMIRAIPPKMDPLKVEITSLELQKQSAQQKIADMSVRWPPSHGLYVVTRPGPPNSKPQAPETPHRAPPVVPPMNSPDCAGQTGCGIPAH